MSFFDSLFGGNAAKAYQPYANQMSDLAHQHYDPYIQQGQQAEQGLPDFYQKLMHNPADFYNEILSGYKPSSGYDYKAQQMMRAAEAAAASGGYLGTPYDQSQREALTQSLLGNDMQQYVNNILGLQNTGLQGLQGYGNRGYESVNRLNEGLSNNLASQGTLAYKTQADKTAQIQQLIGALLKGTGYALGSPATGVNQTLGAKLLGF